MVVMMLGPCVRLTYGWGTTSASRATISLGLSLRAGLGWLGLGWLGRLGWEGRPEVGQFSRGQDTTRSQEGGRGCSLARSLARGHWLSIYPIYPILSYPVLSYPVLSYPTVGPSIQYSTVQYRIGIGPSVCSFVRPSVHPSVRLSV